MFKKIIILLPILIFIGIIFFKSLPRNKSNIRFLTQPNYDFVTSTLTAQQYYILHNKGTEAPFSSPLDYETRPGTYYTIDCHEPVFRSEQKYDSGTGWPSFWAPIKPNAVVLANDNSLGMERTEVLSRCGGHLGHVFDDGPAPTGKRYCINGAALIFIPDMPSTTKK